MTSQQQRFDPRRLNLGRRGFLQGSALALAAGSVGLGFAPEAKAGAPATTVIYLFLRGGMDGLSFIVPTGGNDLGHYLDARDRTRIRIDDADPMRRPLELNSLFGVHPFCSGLHQLFHERRLAIVQAVGHPPDSFTRSHFDAQEQIELGTPGLQASVQGFLTRHLATSPNVDPQAVFSALAANDSPPISLGGQGNVATLSAAGNFHPDPNGTYARTHLQMLRTLYQGSGGLDVAVGAAADAVELISSLTGTTYVPAGGVVYPNTSLARSLSLVAQLVRQDLGIAVATVDYGGWDTHNDQNVLFTGGNNFGGRLQELSQALTAFYRDLEGAGRAQQIVVVVQSEFGRQVSENLSFGTDHGLGNPMLVLGGGVDNHAGGSTPQLFGSFPGIARNQRSGDAVVPTTDFRRVLATVLDRLLGNGNIDQVFPGYSGYTPLPFA